LKPLIERHFPNLVETGYLQTSPATPDYNCIAFTLGDCQRWWWPQVYGDNLQSYWPPDADPQESMAAFIRMYQLHGFELCAGAEAEDAFIKIAIFIESKEGLPAHAALQLPNGKWISKMWDQEGYHAYARWIVRSAALF
jgi:hypothetical protein